MSRALIDACVSPRPEPLGHSSCGTLGDLPGVAILRIVVFTADPNLERTAWWQTVMETPGLSAVVVCRQLVSRRPREVLRRLRRNIAKHGLIFIPYRAVLLAASIARRLLSRAPAEPNTGPSITTEMVEGLDTGDVVAAAQAPIYDTDTLRRVEARAQELGHLMLAASLRQVAGGGHV